MKILNKYKGVIYLYSLFSMTSAGLAQQLFYHDDPFPEGFEKLSKYQILSWARFLVMKVEKVEIREGVKEPNPLATRIHAQMDGFLQVIKTQSNYEYVLYKSKEDYIYNRLESAILCSNIKTNKFVDKTGRFVKDPSLLDGRYCKIAGDILRYNISDVHIGHCKVEVLVSPLTLEEEKNWKSDGNQHKK